MSPSTEGNVITAKCLTTLLHTQPFLAQPIKKQKEKKEKERKKKKKREANLKIQMNNTYPAGLISKSKNKKQKQKTILE